MNDNGRSPAFPIEFEPESFTKIGYSGLTKREMFAMAAMQGIVSNSSNSIATHDEVGKRVDTVVAERAVTYADALLEALNYNYR